MESTVMATIIPLEGILKKRDAPHRDRTGELSMKFMLTKSINLHVARDGWGRQGKEEFKCFLSGVKK